MHNIYYSLIINALGRDMLADQFQFYVNELDISLLLMIKMVI